MKVAREKYLSEFVINNGGSKEQADRTHYLENLMNRNESRFHKTNAAEILGYILSGSDTFAFDGKRFQKVEQFGTYMRQFASQQSELEAKVNKLYFDDYNLIPSFEGWLINIGKGHELNLWRDIYQKGTEESANGSTNSDNTTVAGGGISGKKYKNDTTNFEKIPS